MRRQIATLALLGILGACPSSTPISDAQLAGPNALAVSGGVLLVANTGEAQLNVLRLDPDLGNRAFLRAPNPLFPLAIPTPEFPRAVAGSEGAAPFAFALSSVTNQLSLSSTRQLARLADIDVPTDGMVLAVAVPAGGDDGPQRVFVSATSAGQGTLFGYVFDAALESAPPPADFAPASTLALGASVPQVLVASPVDSNQLAIGDRLSSETAGALALVDLAGGAVERFDIGGPVAALAYDRAGTTLVGIYDVEACAAQTTTCSGVFVFSVTDRQLRTTPGQGVAIPGTPRGLAVGTGTLTIPDLGPLSTELLTPISSSDGSIYLFDAASGRLIPSRNPQAADLSHQVQGVKSADSNGPSEVEISQAMPPQDVAIDFEGVLPSLSDRPGTIADGALTAPEDFTALGVLAGDLVSLSPAAAGCEAEAEVTSVAAGELGLAGLPEGCLGAVSFSVRAARGQYLVRGGASGVMGRVRAGESFAWPAGDAPALSFTMGSGDPQRGASYLISLPPFSIPLSGYSMPGAVVFAPTLGTFYVAYVGRNAVIELRPADLVPGRDNPGVGAFR